MLRLSRFRGWAETPVILGPFFSIPKYGNISLYALSYDEYGVPLGKVDDLTRLEHLKTRKNVSFNFLFNEKYFALG